MCVFHTGVAITVTPFSAQKLPPGVCGYFKQIYGSSCKYLEKLVQSGTSDTYPEDFYYGLINLPRVRDKNFFHRDLRHRFHSFPFFLTLFIKGK
jgi:hypothetical protein